MGADGLVSQRNISTGETRYYQGGPQQEVRQLTDDTGAVTSSYTYTAYGVPVASSGTEFNPHRYGGRVGYYSEGELGLIIATHRLYSPELMRWINRDPIEYAGGDNLYAYVRGNPVGFVDPSGYAPFFNGTINFVLIKPEKGGPLEWCPPYTICDIDAWYEHEGLRPGSRITGGCKVPDNCAVTLGPDGHSPSCSWVTAKDVARKKWPSIQNYTPRFPILPPSWRDDSELQPLVPLLGEDYWNPSKN